MWRRPRRPVSAPGGSSGARTQRSQVMSTSAPLPCWLRRPGRLRRRSRTADIPLRGAMAPPMRDREQRRDHAVAEAKCVKRLGPLIEFSAYGCYLSPIPGSRDLCRSNSRNRASADAARLILGLLVLVLVDPAVRRLERDRAFVAKPDGLHRDHARVSLEGLSREHDALACLEVSLR